MFDRNMNNELENSSDSKESLQKDTYDKIIDTIISNNNMVYKQSNFKQINFVSHH